MCAPHRSAARRWPARPSPGRPSTASSTSSGVRAWPPGSVQPARRHARDDAAFTRPHQWSEEKFTGRKQLGDYLAARNKTLRRVNPQSVLDADIDRAAQAIELVEQSIRSGQRQQTEVPIGPVPHVLHMLGAPMQMLQINSSIISKLLVDKHAAEFANVSPKEFVGRSTILPW